MPETSAALAEVLNSAPSIHVELSGLQRTVTPALEDVTLSSGLRSHISTEPTEGRTGLRSLGAGAAPGYEPFTGGAGDQTQVL